jgi:hypothetical protein
MTILPRSCLTQHQTSALLAVSQHRLVYLSKMLVKLSLVARVLVE